MRRVTVIAGLVLDDEMYERARAALQIHAPREVKAFTWERFIDLASWRLLPNPERLDEPFYKAEFVIKNAYPWKQTVKLNLWRSPDLRKDGAPLPHSHPWRFTGHLLMGGYQEDRYQVARPDLLLANRYASATIGMAKFTPGVVHLAGQSNRIRLTTFHEVTEILEPGRTLSLMNCRRGLKDGWGYLNPETGLYTPNKQHPTDPKFKALFRARNPHLR